MSDPSPDTIGLAMRNIPSGMFVLTCAHDGHRAGLLVNWVQPCSHHPPMVMLAIQRGMPVEPILRSSRSFALCQIGEDDKMLRRIFCPDKVSPDEDPFDAIPSIEAPSGSPVLEKAISFLDCDLARHVDLESDCRLYVGAIKCAQMLNDQSKPAVHFPTNGVAGHDKH